MSLNDISLTSHLLVGIYNKTLVDTGIDGPASGQAVQNDHFYLGDNEKRIVILSGYDDAVHIPDDTLDFLTSILTACQLTIADVAICNLKKIKKNSPSEVIKQLDPKTVLLFGTEPGELDLPARFPHFQKQLLGKITYLSAPRLEEIEADKDLKMNLWICLKNIFNV